jgi:hypothetical protein
MNRRMLGAAAAIVLVLAGGVALQTLSSGSNDDTSTSAAVDATAPVEDAALAATADAATDAATGAGTESADIGSSEIAPTPRSDAELDTGIDDAAPPSERTLDLLETPDDLALFASDAVGAPVSPEVPAATSAPIDDRLTPEQAELLEAQLPLCLGADFVVGPAFYQDTEVVVGVDVSRELALAYVGSTCREVARARLP